MDALAWFGIVFVAVCFALKVRYDYRYEKRLVEQAEEYGLRIHLRSQEEYARFERRMHD